VVAVGEGQEDVAEFNELLRHLQEHYQPDNIQDQLDVEELALCYLGKARAARAEMGEIRTSLDTIRRDHARWR